MKPFEKLVQQERERERERERLTTGTRSYVHSGRNGLRGRLCSLELRVPLSRLFLLSCWPYVQKPLYIYLGQLEMGLHEH